MSFMKFDIVFLILFVIFVSIFLYTRKKNLKREGLLYLYRTKWGMKLIDKTGKKYKKTLKFLSYISITVGYILMAVMVWMLARIIYLYVAYPQIVRAIKVPPIMPLIPYLPQAFKLDFLPPFYFTYFILIIGIIAITHEFSHGIFMRRYGIKIKSTGFGFFPFFFPVFPAAFVEQDEKSMKKANKFEQMVVLSAGTFANVLTAILFFIIMVLFFSLAFSPAGVVFNDYAYSVVEISAITMVNGISVTNVSYDKIFDLMDEEGLNKIKTEQDNYVVEKEFLEKQGEIYNYTFMYFDAPAINVGLEGTITEINNVDVWNLEMFQNELEKYSPGDKIIIKTNVEEEIKEYEIVLDENPEKEGVAYLGVGFTNKGRSGFIGKVMGFMSSFKKPNTFYEPNFEAAEFIYNLLWWLVLISFSVALINMLPVGIFDGGRFFYLTILGLTKSKKKAERTFKFSTYFFLFLLLLLMALWVLSFI